jgi:hypothetical protein
MGRATIHQQKITIGIERGMQLDPQVMQISPEAASNVVPKIKIFIVGALAKSTALSINETASE